MFNSLTTNLIFVSQLIAKGNKVLFKADGCEIFNKCNELVATACLLNRVYKLRMPERLAAVVTSSEVWHRRLGTVNSNYLSKMQLGDSELTIRLTTTTANSIRYREANGGFCDSG